MDKTTKKITYDGKGYCSKTDTPKHMVGVPVLKLLCQWPIGMLAPPPHLCLIDYQSDQTKENIQKCGYAAKLLQYNKYHNNV